MLDIEPIGISLGSKCSNTKIVSGLKQWHKNVFYKTANPVITLANKLLCSKNDGFDSERTQLGTVTNGIAIMIIIINYLLY